MSECKQQCVLWGMHHRMLLENGCGSAASEFCIPVYLGMWLVVRMSVISIICGLSVWCQQNVRSYENKPAGVFVSGFDPTSAVSNLFSVVYPTIW